MNQAFSERASFHRYRLAVITTWPEGEFKKAALAAAGAEAARRVAELLILRQDMPRSLHSCMNFINETLATLCDDSSTEIRRASGELHAKLRFARTDDIIRFGLHEYLMEFLDRISELGDEISSHFLVPTF